MVAHWQVNKDWKLAGGYSFLKMLMHTEDASTDSTKAVKTERSSPQNMFHLNSQLNLQDDLEFNTTLYYVDTVTHYDIQSYMRLDMGLTWHINENMDFSIIGQNLLDKAHPEFEDDSAVAAEVQRGVFGKITLRF